MRSALILPLLLLTGCGQPAAKAVFKDSSIVLPEDPLTLPPGPGMEAVAANCLACHSASTMLQQPKLSREKWEKQVEKMVSIYKAPINTADVPQIVDYLLAQQAADPTIGR